MTSLFVTGSESFIGRELIRQAVGCGHTVSSIDTVPSDRSRHTVGDIRSRDLAAAIPAGTSCIVHLAAISRDGDCRNDPRMAFDVNIMGTQNVLDAAVAAGVPQIVFASSEWVYGDVANESVQTEAAAIDATRISGEYALSKVAGERLVAMAVARGLAAGTVLRFGIVYGPRTTNWSAVESIFAKIGTEPVISVGSGASARRFIHVADIASGILAAVGRSGFEVFNLSGNELITLRALYEIGSTIHGRQPGFVETAPGSPSVRNPDNARAKAILGWSPAYDFRRGLESLAGRLTPAEAVAVAR